MSTLIFSSLELSTSVSSTFVTSDYFNINFSSNSTYLLTTTFLLTLSHNLYPFTHLLQPINMHYFDLRACLDRSSLAICTYVGHPKLLKLMGLHLHTSSTTFPYNEAHGDLLNRQHDILNIVTHKPFERPSFNQRHLAFYVKVLFILSTTPLSCGVFLVPLDSIIFT